MALMKLSQAILSAGEPLVKLLPDRTDPAALEAVLTVATVVWDQEIAKADGRADEFEPLLRSVIDEVTSVLALEREALQLAAEQVRQRKKRMFKSDRRLIAQVRVEVDAQGPVVLAYVAEEVQG